MTLLSALQASAMTLSCSGYAVKTAKHGITKSVLGSVTQKSLKLMSTSVLIAKSNDYVLYYVLIPLCGDVTVVRYFIPEVMFILAPRARCGWG